MGDFNIIRSDAERVGGRPRARLAMDEFNECINSCGLDDWNLEGKQLSWCNGQQGLARSWAKLDRLLVNNSFSLKFGSAVARWIQHDDFLKMVEESWTVDMLGESGLNILAGKLKRLKATLQVWNKEVFGRVDGKIRELEKRIEVLEDGLQNGFLEKVEAELLYDKAELERWVQREDIRLAQQAKEKWLFEGE
ncbi:hypothetical protein F2P56_030019 [Juglans regia]|uniref:Cysteine-rich receptor-like protein kinase n=2 Tax=Juglans regia TaxID=51240 RepID=A0A833WX92_JUGRE|nr:uncharacterized protein LOC108992912 [Juglans regia]KAF5449589.1 hypothetical protein F2P56_030019 [Juglans regia]